MDRPTGTGAGGMIRARGGKIWCMYRHIVLLNLKPDTTDAQRDAIFDRLRALPAQIDALAEYLVGPDLGWADDNAEIGIVARFASRDDFETYRDHPAHLAVITDVILPVIESRRAIQFEE